MHPDTTAATQDRTRRALLLAGLILLAIVLRFWRLGDWNLEATEIFTLRDSLHPKLTNPRPLSYLLNHYLVLPFRPLDEFGLRLLPAIFGVLAIPALYVATRNLIGTRAALLAALALTVSELHVYYSQFARYWSLVFLFCVIFPYALYTGVRQRDRRALAVGVVTAVLAALAHPVAILLLGGPVLWLAGARLRPAAVRELWKRRGFRWGVLAAALVVTVLAVRFVPMLHDWVTMHDRNPGTSQFLHRRNPNGLKQLVYLIAFTESLTVPIVLGAAVGLYLLWRGPDRTLASYLISLAAFPLVFLMLISARTPVSTFYLVPTLPVYFIGLGVFLDRLYQIDWQLRPRWLVPTTLLVIILAAGVPSLLSQYRNGRRFDFRGAAEWIAQRVGPGDVVFSDQPMVLAHYLPGHSVQKLRSTAPLDSSFAELRQSGFRSTLWIVAPQPAHAFRTTLREGGLARWLYSNCQLGNTVGVGRIDFRQQYLQVFRCPPRNVADR